MSRILLLTGMTPDHRIFDRLLPLLPNAKIIDWIQPTAHEPIASYAERLSRTIVHDEPIVVCGVSFGGIVARELAICLNAKACVLISSVRSPGELPPWFRWLGFISSQPSEAIMKTTGAIAAYWPRPLKTQATWRLMKLHGKSGAWHRWAAAAVLTWRLSKDAERVPMYQIHGDRDTTFPIRYTKAELVIKGGGHVLPLTHSNEIAERLRQIAA